MTILLLLFGVGSQWLPAAWSDPAAYHGVSGGLLGIGLLIADVVLPVPSTIVMTAHGALYGVLFGTLVSVVGNVGAAALGFWFGRKGDTTFKRFLTEQDQADGEAFLAKWGEMGLILSRPIPLLAESVAILAGTSPSISWTQLLRAAILGSLPASLVYALVGSFALSLNSGLLAMVGVVLLAGLSWLIGNQLQQRRLTMRTN